MIGLYNKPGRGCKSKFNTEQKEKIREFVKQEPRPLKQVVQKVKEEWGIISSKKTIQISVFSNLSRLIVMILNVLKEESRMIISLIKKLEN
ncbi:helix-turn-helix domain-containing protein [Aphanizomenon flos-aquae NRERC-008]|jgi:hypothetical protein|uniref:Helix-turn-helix domain-containing protein n=1 Tax=Aphanizomenon flos-aquae FACHB-1249 TaxID=2692889 RepID=A0ABR8IW89_APHFL|nr:MULTISPECIES: helix-turn-helix domain-containing protein [Aphanizomenon]MBD2557238.1 helix-turn-helix domain-containing protein [Aphanizomenon flos-aquae FACHB-1290]MCE2903484.1 helix-turn-helix domain-containing protein [Anabaena sp. CoA2_C59]MDJ0505526.1 helix-turn-helix domain-containing protein [Nostocales cyanobacterium LE14-WE12]MBD2391329.1 helix-turn-helix domain-containing protein [Aphanizomenon flos-aquae FACHB-1171]MBD2632490.1 helix-turn-helix domain-containing protein [Aphanizo